MQERPLAPSFEPGSSSSGSSLPSAGQTGPQPPPQPPSRSGRSWTTFALGCAGVLLLLCVCVGVGFGTFYVLEQRSVTPTPQQALRTPQATAPRTSPATPQVAGRGTPPPDAASIPGDWDWFDDPSGQVNLAHPQAWKVYYEESACCNVVLTSFDPGDLPSGRIDWAPPGSGQAYEVPSDGVVVDLFLLAPPFADARPDFGRAPDGEDIVGRHYRAEVYYGAPFTQWPRNQAITYLYRDDQGREWCLVAYFGTPFDRDPSALATVTTVIASIRHGG